MASLINDTIPILRHSLQQSHNKGLYYGFRDAILSRLVTIIKRLVNHAVYCICLHVLSLVLFMQSLYISSLVPRLSLRLAYRAGQRSYVKLFRGRREEPGNEAIYIPFLIYEILHLLVSFHFFYCF